MNRTTQSLIAAVAALAAVTGFAAANVPDGSADDGAKAAARLPVERASLLCPVPSSSDLAETSYTAFTPESKGSEEAGQAELLPATQALTEAAVKGDEQDKKKAVKPFLTSKKPGEPVAAEVRGRVMRRSSALPTAGSPPAGPSSRPPRTRRAAAAASRAPTAPRPTRTSGSPARAPPRTAATTST